MLLLPQAIRHWLCKYRALIAENGGNLALSTRPQTPCPPRSSEAEILCQSHPLGAEKIVVEGPEALASVVAAVGTTHQVLDHQTNVNEADSVVRGQVPLARKKAKKKETNPKDNMVY